MEPVANNKKIVGTIIGIVVGFLIAFVAIQFFFKAPTFDNTLMQSASELNKTCPVMVDQETRLDNAIALPNKVFQYNYTLVNIVKDSVDVNSFEEIMKPTILNVVKTNPDLKSFRDNKVTMCYNYNDMNGVFVTKISITPDLYAE